MALFKKGFLKYLKTGAYADIVIICNGVHYKAHRAILAYSSSYFERLLLSEFRESSQPYVNLGFHDPHNVFPELLAFIYTGRVVITLDNVIPLFALADHYLVDDLSALCDTFLDSNIQRDTAMVIMRSALEFHFDAIIEKCITVIAKNFNHIEMDYDFLPPHLFLQLLQHPYLVVRDETALYRYVCRYIKDRNPDHASTLGVDHASPSGADHASILGGDHCGSGSASEDDVQPQRLLATIRYVWMPYDDLREVIQNPMVNLLLLFIYYILYFICLLSYLHL